MDGGEGKTFHLDANAPRFPLSLSLSDWGDLAEDKMSCDRRPRTPLGAGAGMRLFVFGMPDADTDIRLSHEALAAAT